MLWGTTQDKQKLFDNPSLIFNSLLKSSIQDVPIGLIYRLKYVFNNDSTAIRKIQKIWEENKKTFQGISPYALDSYGELHSHVGTIHSRVEQQYNYIQTPIISAYFQAQFKRLQDFAKRQNIKIIVSYPPMIKNPSFNLDNPKHNQRLLELKANLEKLGIHLCGNPKKFQYPRSFFYNSVYHLNSIGAKKHTKNLIEALKECLETTL